MSYNYHMRNNFSASLTEWDFKQCCSRLGGTLDDRVDLQEHHASAFAAQQTKFGIFNDFVYGV